MRPKQIKTDRSLPGRTCGAPPIQYILEDLEGQTSDAYVAYKSNLLELLQCWQGLSNDLRCPSTIRLYGNS